MLRNQKGFTLMELMIVIVIIGVLAAIAVPAYSNYTKRSQRAVCQANQRTIKTAVQLYYADNTAYPAAGDTTAIAAVADGPDLIDYLDNVTSIKCPVTPAEGKTGGYAISDTGVVTCVDHIEHN